MRIPRPRPPETEFKRKRAPPPQATKLLRASLAAGLVFIVLLVIVFVPRGLQYGDQTPSAILALDIAAGPRIVVRDAYYVFELSNFRANLTRDNVTVASLERGLGGGTSPLSFVDANADGKLGPGDYFLLTATAIGRYAFRVFQAPDDRLVGFKEWYGSLA